MFRESKRLEDIDFLMDRQEFWRISYLEYSEQVSSYMPNAYICCKASNNDEGRREETSRQAQTEVDGQRAERFETTPARSKARTEPRSMEKGSQGDRPRTGIRLARVSYMQNAGH